MNLWFFATGIGLGILVGLSATAVISGVLTTLLGIAAAIVSALPNINNKAPTTLGILVMSLVLGVFIGVPIRTNNVLGQSVDGNVQTMDETQLEQTVALWQSLGVTRAEASKRLFDLRYPLAVNSSTVSESTNRGVVLSAAVTDACYALPNGAIEALPQLVSRSTSTLFQKLAAVVPEPQQLHAVLTTVCNQVSP